MKTTRILALLGLLALTAAAPAVAQETTIKPGWWESTNTASMIISKTERERRCITPADVDKILSGRINRHYTCTYPEKRVGEGKMYFKGVCVDKRGRQVNVTANGTYSPTAFELNADLSGKYGGIPLAASMSTKAKRIGDTCLGDPVKL
ncbi:MAG: DUF3617 family protein [Caulobacter sp.]|nr:DUF3617 family protein [Caulobacter sp.]